MRTLAFDGRMGASGDMLLGALLAAGGRREALEPVEDVLDVRYEVSQVTRCGVSATSVDVLRTDVDSSDHDHDNHGHEHDHDNHDHPHDHDNHDHPHDHDNHDHPHDDHRHAEGGGPFRSYEEVVEIVESMGLAASIEADATAIFELLGEAEASVHGTTLEGTHFHEVGADDAIADVVGVVLLLADLDAERVVTTPLAAGSGEVEMSHGHYPIPPPAVAELAERADWSLRGGPVEAELLTPTGAAVLAHVADGVETLPSLRLERSGYGAGDRSFDDRPNVLRALVGETRDGLRRDSIAVLETNLDDATPEELGGLQETLTDAGALDVSVVPATMKKSRPGHLVKVVVKPEHAERVARRLAVETGTLGVREHGAGHRWIADRRIEEVTVEIAGTEYEIAVKVASAGEEVFDVSAEYDDALAVATETGLPIREVQHRVEAAMYENL